MTSEHKYYDEQWNNITTEEIIPEEVEKALLPFKALNWEQQLIFKKVLRNYKL